VALYDLKSPNNGGRIISYSWKQTFVLFLDPIGIIFGYQFCFLLSMAQYVVVSFSLRLYDKFIFLAPYSTHFSGPKNKALLVWANKSFFEISVKFKVQCMSISGSNVEILTLSTGSLSKLKFFL